MRVSAAGLTATVCRRGARIVSLRDESREWLLQTEPQSEREARARVAFVDSAMAGWDECAPTVDACFADDRAIPDHGDLWNARFQREGDLLRYRGHGYVFERWALRSGSALRLTYRVRASRVMPFLWTAHPLFVAPSGSHVILPDGIRTVLDVTSGKPEERRWSPALGEIDSVPPGSFRKLYVDPSLSAQSAQIQHPDGASLTLRWSPRVKYLGLWFDHSAFARAPVIAIEPSTGFHDSLERAIDNQKFMVLSPARADEWWLEIECT